MTARRVLILYRDSLLAQGLESLLRQQKGLETSATQLEEANVEELVRQFAPDVIIVDRDELAEQTAITIGDLLAAGTGTKVIDVSIRNTTVRLYEGRELSEAGFQDLLAAIDSDRATRKGSIQPRMAPKAGRRTSKGGAE